MIGFDLDGTELVVALGAHPDDIEIGAGGTLLRLSQTYPQLGFLFLVVTSNEQRHQEAVASAEEMLGERVTVRSGGFRDGHLPYQSPSEAKHWLQESLDGREPGLVVAPSLDDLHQDHRMVGRFAWELARRTPILEYEIPKWETEAIKPNLLVALEEHQAKAKLEHLEAHFPSQHGKQSYSRAVFESLMRLRGAQTGAALFAEGFIARKMVIGADGHPGGSVAGG